MRLSSPSRTNSRSVSRPRVRPMVSRETFLRKSGPACAPASRALRTPPMGSVVEQGARAGSGHQRALIIGALGVVYGDIGTSPIYALRESIAATAGLSGTDNAVLGVLSLMFWSLVIVVTIKYVLLIMRADNRGEGGILSLAALALRLATSKRAQAFVVALSIIGVALFYGDGLITPAISVLSAVEGLEVVTPELLRRRPALAPSRAAPARPPPSGSARALSGASPSGRGRGPRSPRRQGRAGPARAARPRPSRAPAFGHEHAHAYCCIWLS